MSARSMRGRRLFVAACSLVLGAAGLAGCNEHPVELSNADGIFDYYPDSPQTEASKVDVLWVIDNSGTMCQEQRELRQRFDSFISEFGERNIDFNIGVTTTHMKPNDSHELVAVPGRLQSTPQPLPSSFDGCIGDEGDPADPTDGFETVRASIEGAVECASDPAQWSDLASLTDGEYVANLTDDEIACAVDPNCAASELEDLFPAAPNGQSPYRAIPTVLSASDPNYQDDEGYVDLDKLERDFACMSFVGNRGFAFEKGLGAAIEAVSPQMTGGTVENPTDASAPNHGLLREDAQLAVIFLTDENDCTHDGSLDEQCNSEVCEFANHPGFEDSPLLSPEELSEDLVRNVAASKGVAFEEFDRREIVVASLHGESNRYGGEDGYPEQMPPSPNTCGEDVEPAFEIRTACNTPDFGSAYSGDRYARFMRTFDNDRIYPRPTANGTLPGLICSPDNFASYMNGVAATIADSVDECIVQKPRGCDGEAASSCGDFAFGGGAGECVGFGNSSRSFCTNAVQVRLFAAERDFEALDGHSYCIPESLDSSMTPDGCVVKRDLYEFETCSGIDAGFTIDWIEDRWFEKLDGFDIEVVISSGTITRR